MTRAARILLAGASILVLVEALSLVERGADGLSDIGIFYRTCTLLREGERAIYPRADAVTGWPISMPPVGWAIFQPFSRLTPWGSSAAWALFNLALLAAALILQRRVLLRTGDSRYVRAWPWSAALLLILSAGSIQVGQFSVLFVTCWLLFLDAFGRSRTPASALWLAIPAAIKIYPVGLLAIPLSMSLESATRRPAAFIGVTARTLAWAAAGVLLMWFAVPALAYGRDTIPLNMAWWHGVILNNAQMDYLQDLRAITNQSLDTVLLRYASYDPAFHDQYAWLPHLAFSKATVLRGADLVRVVIIGISLAAVWKRAKTGAMSAVMLIDVAALWVAVLYNVVPETKSRYAVYTFIAFLPWIARAADPSMPFNRRAWFGGVVVASTICALVLLPDVLQAWGVGFIGPFVLWAGNVRFVTLPGVPDVVDPDLAVGADLRVHGIDDEQH